MVREEMTRREFVTASTAGAGAFALGAVFVPPAAFGANDRLRLGIVGAGIRGQALMKWAHKLEDSHNVQWTAVCDIWTQRRHAAAKKIESWNQKPAAQYRTLDDLCAQEDTDAVLIATADFQHPYHAAKAVLAGKDIYVEKPFGCDFDQIKKAWQIIKASGCVAQMGTQSRGRGVYFGARDFIQSGGLGRVTYAEISDCAFQQYWRIKDCESSIKPEDTDWREFLAYLDPEEYHWNPRHYREFRLFWPFSSGCFCQWMSHRIDLVNLALDSIPRCAVALGGVYLWQDGRTNPDTVQCLLEYPGGTMAAYHMRMGNKANSRGIYLYGTHGMVDLQTGTVSSSGGEGAVLCENPGASTPEFHIDKSKLIPEKTLFPSPPDVDHLGDFFDCVRRRRQPRADVDAGYAHATATIMANMAYRTGRRIEYDAEKMELRPESIA
ncbi:MAG: Gfo/Idh/MocA family oxidoreductase [Candidatus Omnitrophota bacterium]